MASFHPNGIDLALADVSVWRRHQTLILLVGVIFLTSGAVALTLSYTHLLDAQVRVADMKSTAQATRDVEGLRLQELRARAQAERNEIQYIEALQKAGWPDLLWAFETVGRSFAGQVVLLSLMPEERQGPDGAVRATAVALTESSMVAYLDRLRRTSPVVTAELLSHRPGNHLGRSSREMVFLVRWSMSKTKHSAGNPTGTAR